MVDAAQEAAERIRWELIWILMVIAASAVVLLPLGRWGLLWTLVRAFLVLWGVLLLAAGIMARVQRLLRIEDDPPTDAYVLTNLAVGLVLLVPWTAYVALAVRGSAAGAPIWAAVPLYVIGLLVSHAGFGTVSVIYGGSLYRTVNALVAVGGYALFALWPPAARAAFGWLA